MKHIFNRPSIVGAVLQTLWSVCCYSFNQEMIFPPESLKYYRALKWLELVLKKSYYYYWSLAMLSWGLVKRLILHMGGLNVTQHNPV